MATGARVLNRPPAKTTQAETQTLEERIRRRAHELYIERGSEDGAALDDWLQAEQEVIGAAAVRRES